MQVRIIEARDVVFQTLSNVCGQQWWPEGPYITGLLARARDKGLHFQLSSREVFALTLKKVGDIPSKQAGNAHSFWTTDRDVDNPEVFAEGAIPATPAILTRRPKVYLVVRSYPALTSEEEA